MGIAADSLRPCIPPPPTPPSDFLSPGRLQQDGSLGHSAHGARGSSGAARCSPALEFGAVYELDEWPDQAAHFCCLQPHSATGIPAAQSSRRGGRGRTSAVSAPAAARARREGRSSVWPTGGSAARSPKDGEPVSQTSIGERHFPKHRSRLPACSPAARLLSSGRCGTRMARRTHAHRRSTSHSIPHSTASQIQLSFQGRTPLAAQCSA